ncbi:MAG: RDD family protein [Armatimonadota bacterium]|nr:RDD family protein [Armatimonadota bacterium]MDR5696764.1 RDD family protein [Armatimonadota bacterium]
MEASSQIPGVPVGAEYAGFWRRLAALLIDGVVVGLAGGVVLRSLGLQTDDPLGAGNLAAIVIGWLYFALLESSPAQATVGKMVLGIVVTDLAHNRISFARATGRHFGKILSAVILFIGFLMAAFTERKQALHDIVAGCLVMRRA